MKKQSSYYVFSLIQAHPKLLAHCSLSADRLQLATDITSLYKHFFKEGFHAMGMYKKIVVSEQQKNKAYQFITQKTFFDI